MSSFVDQHQLSSYATPVAGGALAASVVLSNDNTTVTGYNAHDADATIHVQDSTLAAKPAASVTGRKWMTVDSSAVALYFDTGGAWLPLNTFPAAVSMAGLLTSTKTGNFLLNQTATTGNVYAQLTNTSGQMYLGLESSVGGTIVTGSTAYDTVLTGQTGITFSANNGSAVSMRLNSSHALNVVGALTTGGLLTVQSRILNTTGDLDLDANAANAVRINRTGGTGGFIVYAGGTSTTNMVITDAGAVSFRGLIQTTLTSQQLSLKYDGSNDLAITVSSAGAVTYNATGASAAHNFSDPVAVTGLLSTTTNIALDATGRIYLDGRTAGGDTYITTDGTGDIIEFFAGGAQKVNVATTGLTVVATDYKVTTAASSTVRAGLNLPSGTAPSSPAEGDFWYDGTNLKFRDSTTSRTINWT